MNNLDIYMQGLFQDDWRKYEPAKEQMIYIPINVLIWCNDNAK